MTKQTAINIIENIIDKINQKQPTDWKPRDRDAFLLALACINEINVPKVEECEVKEYKHQIECLKCKHLFKNETLLITFNKANKNIRDYRFYKVSFCPNCGCKIKKGE